MEREPVKISPSALEEEAKARWGETEAYREYEARGDKTGAAAEGLMELFRGFGEMRELEPDSPEALAQAERLKAYITAHYYTCTDEILAGLGRAYICDSRMRANIDKAGGEGTAEFASRAIEAYIKSRS